MTGGEFIDWVLKNHAEDIEMYYLGYVDDEHKITCADIVHVQNNTIISVE